MSKISQFAKSSDGLVVEFRLEKVDERRAPLRTRLVVEAKSKEIDVDRLTDLVASELSYELSEPPASWPPGDRTVLFEFSTHAGAGLLDRIARAVSLSEVGAVSSPSEETTEVPEQGTIFPVKVTRKHEVALATLLANKVIRKKNPIYSVLALESWRGWVIIEASDSRAVDESIRGFKHVRSSILGVMPYRDLEKFLVPGEAQDALDLSTLDLSKLHIDSGFDRQAAREEAYYESVTRPGHRVSYKRYTSFTPKRR